MCVCVCVCVCVCWGKKGDGATLRGGGGAGFELFVRDKVGYTARDCRTQTDPSKRKFVLIKFYTMFVNIS